MSMYRTKARLYWNADKTAIIAGDASDAAFLLAPEGGEVSEDIVETYNLGAKGLVERVSGTPSEPTATEADEGEPAAEPVEPEPEEAEAESEPPKSKTRRRQ
jgi:hypothetical protein